MSKEINDHRFASTAVDDGYHSQHRLKEATMTATRISRRWLAAFIVACICAFAAVTLAQSADPTSEQRAAGEPYTDMPLIAPIGVRIGKYVDVHVSSQGPAIDEKAAPIFVNKSPCVPRLEVDLRGPRRGQSHGGGAGWRRAAAMNNYEVIVIGLGAPGEQFGGLAQRGL